MAYRKRTMKKIIVLGIGIFFNICFIRTAFAYDSGDWQFWNTENIKGEISERCNVSMEEEFRFGDSMKELYYQHTDIGIGYELVKWFPLSVNYRHIYEKGLEEWKNEKRPYISGTVKWNWKDLKFEDKNRFEYRIKSNKKDTKRYRNKLSIKFPLKWSKFEVQPYVSDEIFVDIPECTLTRNRIYAGFNSKLMNHIKTDIFYLYQASKKDRNWPGYNVVGAKIKFYF